MCKNHQNYIFQCDNENFLIDNDENDFLNKQNQHEKFFNEFFNSNLELNDFVLKKNKLDNIPLNINFLNKKQINHQNLLENKNENLINNKFIIKKENKIFNIKKEIKLGRPKKFSFKKGKHDKFQKDNLIRRFKAQFVQNLFNYINSSFKFNGDNKKHINILQKINSSETK